MSWFEEKLYGHWRQTFQVDETLFRLQTGLQELVIFRTPHFGRVLALDGVIQVTEGDEFVYHEMLAHTTQLAHGAVRTMCIVGGGDGGVLREALKHPGLERAVLVEIDRGVIDMCAEHMPAIPGTAFADPRTEVVIADGLDFMAHTDRRFDVIIVDSTDPHGPGEVLFTESFYADCKRRLNPGGIVATQNGVPFLQPDELVSTYRKFRALFADPGFFVAAVPTYVGGFMTLGWGSDQPSHRTHSAATIRQRFERAPFKTRYWNPEIQVASFALPQYVRDLMAGA